MNTKDKTGSCESKKKISVGGQALMEGVLMLGPAGAGMSVRRNDGRILTQVKPVKHIRDKYKVLGVPVIRGIVNFVEQMISGYKSLMESAELSGGMEVEQSDEEMSKLDKWINDHFGPKMLAVVSVIAMILGVALSVFLFMYLPALLVDLFDKYLVTGSARFDVTGIYALNRFHPIFEGILRIIIFVSYIAIVSLQKDIKRTFMYHGAEHKSIFCYEAGKELTVENARSFKRFHPRCGTSFIFVVIILSILISSLLVILFPSLGNNRILWTAIKLLIAPLVMGIGYEFIRYAGTHTNICTKILSAPGLWMQRLTTKEPTDDIIEVGLASLRAALTGVVPESEIILESDRLKPSEAEQKKEKTKKKSSLFRSAADKDSKGEATVCTSDNSQVDAQPESDNHLKNTDEKSSGRVEDEFGLSFPEIPKNTGSILRRPYNGDNTENENL